MRCLALAQAWKKAGGRAVFFTRREGEALEARIRSEGFELRNLRSSAGSTEDAHETGLIASEIGASWIILDGYSFGPGYQDILKGSGSRVLYIDDYGHLDRYPADMVLNQNLGIRETLYAKRAPETKLLLGPDYILLRQEFLRWKSWKRQIPEIARRILVTLGGGDSGDPAFLIIQSLQSLSLAGMEMVLLAGAINPQATRLQKEITLLPCKARVLHNTRDMAEIMAWADIAISAAGSTAWELACMGVPSLLMVLAENQMSVARELDRRRIGLNLGDSRTLTAGQVAAQTEKLMLSAEQRSGMSLRGRQLVDGFGVDRVLSKMLAPVIHLRPAEEGDCRFVWEWANENVLRERSFSQDPIPWERHQQWFRSKVHDPDSLFYIALDAELRPIGQARFDLDGNEAVISVGIDAPSRGRGYGTALIELASKTALRTRNLTVIHAYVKRHNGESVRAFRKAGFREGGLEVILGQEADHLILSMEESTWRNP